MNRERIHGGEQRVEKKGEKNILEKENGGVNRGVVPAHGADGPVVEMEIFSSWEEQLEFISMDDEESWSGDGVEGSLFDMKGDAFFDGGAQSKIVYQSTDEKDTDNDFIPF